MEQPEQFNYVHASLLFAKTSLNEIEILAKPRPVAEIKIIHDSPFDFYRVTLHYCFIMEYMKLVETPKYKWEQKKNVSNLENANAFLFSLGEEKFIEQYHKNINILAGIRTSSLYSSIQILRNKKFAHFDISSQSNPLSITYLTDEEISQAKLQLHQLAEIHQSFCMFYEYGFLFESVLDNRTDIFIKDHAKFQEFYWKDFFKNALNKT